VVVLCNFHYTRGGPGRLALLVSVHVPPVQLPDASPHPAGGGVLREAPLEQAQESLRPVRELIWQLGDLHLRMTAQGQWDEAELLTIAASVG
jgi:hypothetical protein